MKSIQVYRGNPNDLVSFLKQKKKTFRVVSSNYSVRIYEGEKKYIYTKDKNKNLLFSAYNLIKKDLAQTDYDPGEIAKSNIKYYGISEKLKNGFYAPEVTNFDIKQAYATELKNLGLISADTFNKLAKYPKDIRLKSVGMIARKKTTYFFKDGEFTGQKFEQDQRGKNIFNLLCLNIGRKMDEIQAYLGDNFLFFWVDGIYLLPGYNEQKNWIIERHFTLPYVWKKETLKNFTIERDERAVKIQFLKEDNPRYFYLPIFENHKMIL